jgi:hypothetical protein
VRIDENHKFARGQAISGNCGTHGICFCNNSIIVHVEYITIETKEAARIRHSKFLLVHLGLHLSSQAERIMLLFS